MSKKPKLDRKEYMRNYMRNYMRKYNPGARIHVTRKQFEEWKTLCADFSNHKEWGQTPPKQTKDVAKVTCKKCKEKLTYLRNE